MKQDQEKLAPHYCPRCGGPMQKPAGGTLYWHVNNNHPRCNITNISAVVLEVRDVEPDNSPPVSKPPSKA